MYELQFMCQTNFKCQKCAQVSLVQHIQIFILNEQKYNIKPFKLSKNLFDLALWLPYKLYARPQYCTHNSFFLHLWISQIYIRQYPAIEYCVRNKIIVSYFESVFFRISRAGYTEPVHCFVKTLKLFKTSVAFLEKVFVIPTRYVDVAHVRFVLTIGLYGRFLHLR